MSAPAAPKPLPSGSRILAADWSAKLQAAHQARLQQAKSRVDTAPPISAGKRLKRDKERIAREAELQRIDRDNRLLLERMAHIQATNVNVGTPESFAAASTGGGPFSMARQLAPKKASLNSSVRAREQERILEANAALVARLKAGKGHFDKSLLAKHERQYLELKEAAKLLRAPPPAVPAPKLPDPRYRASTAGGDSERKDDASSSDSALSKSHSVSSLPSLSSPLRRPGSSAGGLGSSASSRSLSLSASPKPASRRTTVVRPAEETHDSRGAVQLLTTDTPPPVGAPRGTGLITSERRRVDGRWCSVSVEEVGSSTAAAPSASTAAVAASPSSPSSPTATATSSSHALHFRTHDVARASRGFVSVPFALIAELPECVAEATLLDPAPASRATLAGRLCGRLRFHDGKHQYQQLAFNPSHALANPAATAEQSPTTTSVWDKIGRDGQLEPDEEEAAAAHAAASSASSASPAKKAPIGTHHLAYTTTAVLRAGHTAEANAKNLIRRQEAQERKEKFKAMRARSQSPQRAFSPSRYAIAGSAEHKEQHL